MKNSLFTAVLTFLFLTVQLSLSAQNFKVNISIYNATNQTINAVGVQKGLSIDPKSASDVITTNPIAPKTTYRHPKKIKLKKGQSLYFYLSTDKTKGMRYHKYHKFDEKKSSYTLPIDRIDTTQAITQADQIQEKLNQIGIDRIDESSGVKIDIVTSDISNIMSYLPALVIYDKTKIKNKNQIIGISDVDYYRPEQLDIIPEPLKISGQTIKDHLTIESNGNFSNQFQFPFAADLDLSIRNKGFYEVTIIAEDAGWIPVKAKNVRTPTESFFLLDSIAIHTTLVGMYTKLKNNPNYRMKVVQDGFVFNKLLAQTKRYVESDLAYKGSYGSIITSTGGYVRSTDADHVDSRPATLVYARLGNDVTDEALHALENIILKEVIEKYKIGAPQDKKLVEALPKEKVNAIKNFGSTELNNLEQDVEKELQYLEAGIKEFESQNWETAKIYFDFLVENNPTNVNFLERRGYCNYGLKRYPQALDDFSKAIGLSENGYAPQLYFFRGNTHIKMNNFDLALQDFNSLLAIQPNHLNATNQRGLAYAKSGNIEDACKDFKRVLEHGIPELKEKAQININNYCK